MKVHVLNNPDLRIQYRRAGWLGGSSAAGSRSAAAHDAGLLPAFGGEGERAQKAPRTPWSQSGSTGRAW